MTRTGFLAGVLQPARRVIGGKAVAPLNQMVSMLCPGCSIQFSSKPSGYHTGSLVRQEFLYGRADADSCFSARA